MATRNTNQNPTPTAPAEAAPLPTHGGLYEFDPASNAMRAVEGGPPKEKPAQTPDATTGDQP